MSQDRDGNHFTPPFPAYTSGHSTLGGAWAGAMRDYFDTDDVTFTATTDGPNAAGVTRTFNSFSEAGKEDATSRIYLGVHYRFDTVAGFDSGQRLGDYVAAHFLR